MDREAWCDTAHEVTKLDTTEVTAHTRRIHRPNFVRAITLRLFKHFEHTLLLDAM